ncbi:D-alanyl-D-alanine carboxypeptidase family protein [Actinokineospora sp. UTMC 2448]|uniref:D-alanyl-D-alanine carboxypeptidase family protein n=1 Tax=Actinokineospora sp. UTMC 2448 TaxID=2268449 RepID=UPI0021649049|nr:serine hydrolase [Actinokineospora sp. UTMC 2448]UVS82021.1 D-alanyl-D-alanine carboxypeptidase DacB precursor [Actinokineospora sp. UTMC 2448]
MRFAARGTVAALLALLTAAPAAAQPATGEPLMQTSAQCRNHDRPPPAIDTSEEPKPGDPSPTPLPVPPEPVGGTRMGECGLVLPPEAPALPGAVNAAAWIITDVSSGTVLAAKDPHARERPASLIKMLLAITAVRELRPEQIVVGTPEDAQQEGSRVGIGPGGEYTVDQLLHALLMRSGNDVAHALARALGGVPVALEKMNALARELGALDTRAATPSGLDGPGMSTSAYDIALIFREGMEHAEIAKALRTRSLTFPGHGDTGSFEIYNDNKLWDEYEGFTGGTAGFTDSARHTYLGSAERDGRQLAVVLLRGEPNPDPLAGQGALLLDYGFALVDAGRKPVGELVTGAPDAQPKPDGSVGSVPVTEPPTTDGEDHQTATGPDTERSAFGTYGMPLVVAAGLGILVALALFLRKKRAARARAARTA